MSFDIEITLVGQVVRISVNGGDWTLSRQSHTIGDIFCEDEYLFIEDHTADGYTAFAPLVGDAGVKRTGETKEDAQRALNALINDHERLSTMSDIEGRLSVATPESTD